MITQRVYLFDTTLRDGAQTHGVDFSVSDKLSIIEKLDQFGIDYIEAGFPGTNPTDEALFANSPRLHHAHLTAFGMTRRSTHRTDDDPLFSSLLNTPCDAICLVGKTWDFHVKVALGIQRDENLTMIQDSITATQKQHQTLFDAEHFFDGYKADPAYALECLKVAYKAGAKWIVLCDTNGGTLPYEIDSIVENVQAVIPGSSLGIHTHNDTGNAIANSLIAVKAGVHMVQGTINGLGERCGNANLITLIPTLMFKMGYTTGISSNNLKQLVALSRTTMNISDDQPISTLLMSAKVPLHTREDYTHQESKKIPPATNISSRLWSEINALWSSQTKPDGQISSHGYGKKNLISITMIHASSNSYSSSNNVIMKDMLTKLPQRALTYSHTAC